MSHRVRLLFQNRNTYRKFWWFEMKGDDLYWGPSFRGYDSPSIPFKGDSVTITIPEQLEEAEKAQHKASYHESGQFHLKINHQKDSKGRVDSIYQWRQKGKISEPFRICAVISKQINEYEIYNKSPTSKNASALVFKVGDKYLPVRHYFEFFISPPGKFPIPMPVIKTKDSVLDTPTCVSLNEKYILVVRQLIFSPDSDFNKFHPSKEFSFFFEDTTQQHKQTLSV